MLYQYPQHLEQNISTDSPKIVGPPAKSLHRGVPTRAKQESALNQSSICHVVSNQSKCGTSIILYFQIPRIENRMYINKTNHN